jgi:3-oxoadipate enol-lactonase
MKIKANKISMNYEVAGEGRWLTLIHGAGDNLGAWWNQVPALSKRYRVLTYDVRGHGQTETPPAEYTIGLLVQDLYELLKALKVRETYLLGYSMGGRIALGLTLEHPEMVKALILANSGVAPIQRSQEEMKQMMEMRQRQMEIMEKQGLGPVMDEMTVRALSPGFAEKNPKVFARYKEIRLKNDPRAYATLMKAMPWAAQPPDVSSLKLPTLIIAGEHDLFSGPEAAKASQRLIKGSKLVVMPTGHAAAIEQPDKFNKTILDFLAGLEK